MSHSAHDLEFIMTNVEIAASIIGRMMSGKTSTDWMNWEHEMASPVVTFLVDEMWAL